MNAATLSFGQLLELVLRLPSEEQERLVVALREEKKAAAKRLRASDFSFRETRKRLSGISTSLSDAVIEERRSAL